MRSNEFDCSLTLKLFSVEEMMEIENICIEEIQHYLTGLKEVFNQYFVNEQQVNNQSDLWIKNPFIVNAQPSTMTFDSPLQEKFKQCYLEILV